MRGARRGIVIGAAMYLSFCLTSPSSFADALTIVVARANADSDQRTGQPILTVQLAPASVGAFRRLLDGQVGRTMALRVNGETVITSVVREPLVGTWQISGDLNSDRYGDIAARLSADDAKVEIELVDK
ncbi:MAG: SecDF P1 head subdomain-containing protein [Xanthobacteraceae bacterium]